MLRPSEIIKNFNWSNLSQDSAWSAWKEAKNHLVEALHGADSVAIDSLGDPSPDAISELQRRCQIANFGIYQVAQPDETVADASAALVAFARHFGLIDREDHRSARDHGVVALRTTAEEAQKGYIPYTTKPLNWHTDGYYNAPGDRVLGFVLHCHAQAHAGGENQILDPEIAYLRLREENPDYIAALMHPQAMVIPENREPDGSVRPASVGPVFFADPSTGRLAMRYTARTRSIAWRDDATTQRAVGFLRELLDAGDPAMGHIRLAPGQGILNNNVLHNRTRFEDGDSAGETRVMLRVRFHVRVGEDQIHGHAE